MTAQKYDIDVDQGATLILNFVYKDGDGVPIPLGGFGATFQIRDQIGGKVYAYADVTGGRITVDDGGNIRVEIPHTETTKMDIPRGVWHLFLSEPGGTPVNKILYGDVTVNPV